MQKEKDKTIGGREVGLANDQPSKLSLSRHQIAAEELDLSIVDVKIPPSMNLLAI